MGISKTGSEMTFPDPRMTSPKILTPQAIPCQSVSGSEGSRPDCYVQRKNVEQVFMAEDMQMHILAYELT